MWGLNKVWKGLLIIETLYSFRSLPSHLSPLGNFLRPLHCSCRPGALPFLGCATQATVHLSQGAGWLACLSTCVPDIFPLWLWFCLQRCLFFYRCDWQGTLSVRDSDDEIQLSIKNHVAILGDGSEQVQVAQVTRVPWCSWCLVVLHLKLVYCPNRGGRDDSLRLGWV